MTITLHNVTLDCDDPQKVASFWSAALGRPIDGLFVAQILLIGIDDFDTCTAECIEEIVELVGGGDLRRQHLIHLVVQQIALFLADIDQLPYFVVFFFNRHQLILGGRPHYTCRRARARRHLATIRAL